MASSRSTRAPLAWRAWLAGVVMGASAAACESPTPVEPPRVMPPDAAFAPDASVAPNDGSSPDASTRTDLDRLDALIEALARASDDPARASLFAAFVREVAYGERGFPIRAAGKLAIVHWDTERRGESLTVSGDFNGWSTTASPFTQPVAGVPLYVRIQADPAPASRSLYKLVRGGSSWLADPLARRHGYDENGEYSLLEAGRERAHLERWPAFGEGRGLLEARTLSVWVPPLYDEKAKPGYPVLLMHDGQNLFGPGGPNGSFRADVSAEEAVSTGAVRPFVLVGIPNSPARFDEYTHVKDTLPGYGTTGGRADEYASFVTAGILPFVRARYALRPESSQTALLGSSLGGLVSLYIGLKNRSSFGYAGAMSGTMSWGSIGVPNTGKTTIRELYMAAPPRGLSVYLDSGGDDGGGCGTLSALDSELYHDQYCETSQMRDTLTSLGWVSGRDLVYAWTPRAAHDERAWASRLPALFRNWFPGR